jgi:hypothetical protein
MELMMGGKEMKRRWGQVINKSVRMSDGQEIGRNCSC